MLSGTDKWKGLVDFQLEPLNPGSDILCYTSLPTTLYDALCKTAQSFPDKTAIVDNYDRSCTYTICWQRQTLLLLICTKSRIFTGIVTLL